MKIAISGGTGFVGTALCDKLAKQGHTVYILTRRDQTSANEQIQYVKWDANQEIFPIETVDACVNLAGESLNSGRWTTEKKKQIIKSRVETTAGLIRQLQALAQPPTIFINASAVGYYGTSLQETFTEQDAPGHDFLATTVVKWENEAQKASAFARVAYVRFGIVLGEGGALPKMVLPYKLFAGGTVGSGEQWVSWVHLDDVVNMLIFALTNHDIEGPLNATSPNPVQMKEFGKTIARVLHRPHWLAVPSFAMKAALGEMSMLLLQGQKVLPQKALRYGYEYAHPHLEEALQTILK